MSALQKDAEPVQKITIVPRTMGALGIRDAGSGGREVSEYPEGTGGYAGWLPWEDSAAEEIVFDSVTTGAANDIEQATQRLPAP